MLISNSKYKNYHGERAISDSNVGDYTYYNLDVSIILEYKDKKIEVNFQNGHDHVAGNYNCPSNLFTLYNAYDGEKELRGVDELAEFFDIDEQVLHTIISSIENHLDFYYFDDCSRGDLQHPDEFEDLTQ